MGKKLVSILTPVYNEEENIPLLYARVAKVMSAVADRYDYEHIFSDNASQDDSFKVLKELHAKDPRVKVIRLSKNFGVTPNVVNGLGRCGGDAVIQLDADLQDPPELISDFLKKWEEGCMVVYGVRTDRDEFFLMKWARMAFYRVASWISTEKLIPDVGEFRLMDRRILEEVKKVNDRNPYLRGIVANLGFSQAGVPYKRPRREKGKSSHNLFTLMDYGINGVISHSKVLLRLSTMTGFLVAGFSVVLILRYIITKIFYQNVPQGITSILILVCFFAGIQMIFLGIIGEYISKIYEQSVRRPIAVEEVLVGFGPGGKDPGGNLPV